MIRMACIHGCAETVSIIYDGPTFLDSGACLAVVVAALCLATYSTRTCTTSSNAKASFYESAATANVSILQKYRQHGHVPDSDEIAWIFNKVQQQATADFRQG